MVDGKKAVVACSCCQAFIIILTGLVGIIIHYTTLTGAEKIYVARDACGKLEGWKDYKCVDVDPKATYYDYDNQDVAIPEEQLYQWKSSQGKICQKDNADDPWVTLSQTCDEALTMCQIWLLDSNVGASASVGSKDPVIQAGLTVVDKCVGGNCKTPEQKHLNARCGLTDEGKIRTGLVYEFDSWIPNDMMVPPFPRPALWMIYKLVQVVRNLGKPTGWSQDGVGHNVELLLDSFPLMHIMLGEASPVVHVVSAVADFFKFSLAPTLMLGILTSMEGAPCEGNAACESNTEKMYLSFNADFNMTTWLYAATGFHLFLMLFGSCGLACCIGSEKIEEGCNFKEKKGPKIGAAMLTFMDVVIVMIGLVTLLTQLSRANIGFAMLFNMAFAFNASVEVDIFQFFALFVLFYDVGATILYKMNKALGWSGKDGN
jgi:hypothetical protein